MTDCFSHTIHSHAGPLPRESRASIRSQARLTGDSPGSLTPRQRRSASMHAPTPAQQMTAPPMTARRSSMPPSQRMDSTPLAAEVYSRRGSSAQGGLPVRRTADKPAILAAQPPLYQAAAMRASGDSAEERGISAAIVPPQVATRRVSSTAAAYNIAGPAAYRRASVVDMHRATAEVFPERAGMQPLGMSMQSGAQETVAGGKEYLTAPYTQQGLEIPEQTQVWQGGNQNVAVNGAELPQSAPQQQVLASRRGSVASAAQSEPQMRASRLSLSAPSELRQPDGAFSLLPGPRASFAAARRASAPVNALPHIPEEPPVQQVSGATPGVLFAMVLRPSVSPHYCMQGCCIPGCGNLKVIDKF